MSCTHDSLKFGGGGGGGGGGGDKKLMNDSCMIDEVTACMHNSTGS